MIKNILFSLLQTGLTPEPKGSGRAGGSVAWASVRGNVRKENQDRLLVAQAQTGLTVAVLADGMGGMKEGARAAAVATSAAMAHCMSFPTLPTGALLAGALRFANDEVFRLLHGEGGAVLVLAAWSSAGRYVAHAGDARAYQVDREEKLIQLTADDTVNAQLRNLGRPPADGSRLHDQLVQFVGVGRDFDPHVLPVSDEARGLVLTSDGVHCMPLYVMDWIVRSAGHIQAAAERLVIASEWHGGRDNGTAVALTFHNSDGAMSHPGGVECWLPGDHIVVVDPEPPDMNRPTVANPLANQRKQRKKKGKVRNRPKPGAPSSSKLAAATDRQLPIIDFGAVVHGLPSTDATTASKQATPPLTPPKRGEQP